MSHSHTPHRVYSPSNTLTRHHHTKPLVRVKTLDSRTNRLCFTVFASAIVPVDFTRTQAKASPALGTHCNFTRLGRGTPKHVSRVARPAMRLSLAASKTTSPFSIATRQIDLFFFITPFCNVDRYSFFVPNGLISFLFIYYRRSPFSPSEKLKLFTLTVCRHASISDTSSAVSPGGPPTQFPPLWLLWCFPCIGDTMYIIASVALEMPRLAQVSC